MSIRFGSPAEYDQLLRVIGRGLPIRQAQSGKLEFCTFNDLVDGGCYALGDTRDGKRLGNLEAYRRNRDSEMEATVGVHFVQVGD